MDNPEAYPTLAQMIQYKDKQIKANTEYYND